MAPELYSGTFGGPANYTTAADIWSLGAIAFCVRTGKLQDWRNEVSSHFDTLFHPLELFLRRRISNPDCIDFIRMATDVRPLNRLTAQQALDHNWLVGFGDEVDEIYQRSNASQTA